MAKQPAKGRKTPAKPKSAAPKTVKSKTVKADSVKTDVVSADTPQVKPAPKAKAVPEAKVSQQVTKPEPTEIPIKDTKGEAQKTPDPKPQPNPVPQPTKHPEPQAKRGSVLPLVFGGIIAGGIGYGAAYLTLPQADPMLDSRVASQAQTLADLQNQIANIPAIDPARLDAGDAARADMSGRLDALDEQLAGLLTQPAGDGSLSAANIAAYQQELENLRTDVEDLRGSAVAELENARATAASIEANADAAARAAAGRAALARVQGAIETGAPMGAPLDELADATQADVPSGLSAVRDGTPTLASLQADFPDAARAALNTARAEGVSGEAESGIGAFLRNQFSVRSTAPQDGDSADAILSRAQDAVSRGRLADALSEMSALPEVARAPLSDWIGRAEMRVDAVAAAAQLTEQLNAN